MNERVSGVIFQVIPATRMWDAHPKSGYTMYSIRPTQKPETSEIISRKKENNQILLLKSRFIQSCAAFCPMGSHGPIGSPTCLLVICGKKSTAERHWLLFSQALMAAVKLMTCGAVAAHDKQKRLLCIYVHV